MLAYAADAVDLMRHAAVTIDRVLKGSSPADPVQSPEKFIFAINLKGARALGLDVPQTLLATADEVVE